MARFFVFCLTYFLYTRVYLTCSIGRSVFGTESEALHRSDERKRHNCA